MVALTRLLKRRQSSSDAQTIGNDVNTTAPEKVPGDFDDSPVKIFRFHTFATALIVSMGGLIFGFDTGNLGDSIN